MAVLSRRGTGDYTVSKKENNRFDALFGAARNAQAAPPVDSSLDNATAPQAIEPVPSTLPDSTLR